MINLFLALTFGLLIGLFVWWIGSIWRVGAEINDAGTE